MPQIPFDSPRFRSDDLEEFVGRFLSAGISLAVEGPEGLEERRVLRAYRTDKTGGVSDGGVDVIAKVEGGETWGFQCKLYTRGQLPKWRLANSERAKEEATYTADRYFLVVVTQDIARDAVEFINNQERWQFWDADTLSSQFLTRVPFERGMGILGEFFDQETAASCYGLPRDEVLVTGEKFFASTSHPDRPFNHLSPLVGRRELLAAIHDFVESSPKKLLLISARGGEGKSRTLAGFASEFDERFPGRSLRFVNPIARDGDVEGSLAFLLKRGLVAVHEDAHRIETLRRSLLGAIGGEAGAKLILTTRPQGIQAIREILKDDCGITVDDIEAAPALPPLGTEEMTKLAAEVLGPNPGVEPHVLAGWADRSPLVCVVGGNLIRTKELPPHEISSSASFREEVFDRFEQQNLRHLSSGDTHRGDVLRRLLRALAVLAPFPSDKDSLEKLGEALGIDALDLDERMKDLGAAELISKTQQGWRVGPDLFADHLVYAACVGENGEPTIFCDRIIQHFGTEDLPRLLRNLSEAEWRARCDGSGSSSLTEPLWRRFLDRFDQGSFRVRAEMLEAWSAFSFFLPEKSIALAKHALVRDTASEDEVVFKSLYIKPSTHGDVVKKLPPLLQPVGIYHLDHQDDVFDLLAPLGRDWSPRAEIRMREEQNHPWVVIAKAASFSLDQPLHSVEGVIRWIGSRWRHDWMADLVDQRGPFLSLVLEPVFKRIIERTVWQGRTAHFQTIALSVKETAPARQAVYDLIESSVLPRGEIATLNAIPVLNAATEFWEGISERRLDRSAWRPDRLSAIGLLRECCRRWDTPFVKFFVWQSLVRRVLHESDEEIVHAAREALASIGRDTTLQIAFSTLGNDGDLLLDDELTHETDYEKSWHRWRAFHPALAVKLLEESSSSGEWIVRIEDFDRQAQERGFDPNWGPLVGGLASLSASFAEAAIERCFENETTPLDRVFAVILHDRPNSDEKLKDEWLARAVGSAKEELRCAALGSLRWHEEPPGDRAADAIRELLGEIAGPARNQAIHALGEALSLGKLWPWKLIEAIPFTKVDDETLKHFVTSLVRGVQYRGLKIDIGDLHPILDRMVMLDSIYDDPYQEMLRLVSELSPDTSYQFIRRRIRTLETHLLDEARPYSYTPTPSFHLRRHWIIPNLREVPEYPNYLRELADEIRKPDSPSVYYWQDLFQAAVLLPDDEAGVCVLSQWLEESSETESVAAIAEIFNVSGTTMVFRQAGFLKRLLERAAQLDHKTERRIKNILIPDTNGRGYSNGELDKDFHWVLDEARKASSKFAGDPVLMPFFEEVIRREERDRERNREEYQNHMLATD